MEKNIILGIDQVTLIRELNQGREFTKQLQNHLGPLSSLELCDLLIQKILSSYEKAISLLNGGDLVREFQIDGILETSRALSGSNRMSEVSRAVNKKRSYYRCAYRHTQDCMATKQVQNSDEDTLIIKITYKGRHTSEQASQLSPHLASLPKNDPQQNQYQPHLEEGNQNLSQETIVEFGTNLKIKSDKLGFMDETFVPISFSLSPTSIEFQNMETNTSPEENKLLGSETYYFPLLQCHNLQRTELNLYEAISAPTLLSNLPVGGLDFSFDRGDVDPNFMFGASEFSS